MGGAVTRALNRIESHIDPKDSAARSGQGFDVAPASHRDIKRTPALRKNGGKLRTPPCDER